MKIKLNEKQSKILIDIALKDLLPKELERIKRQHDSKFYGRMIEKEKKGINEER